MSMSYLSTQRAARSKSFKFWKHSEKLKKMATFQIIFDLITSDFQERFSHRNFVAGYTSNEFCGRSFYLPPFLARVEREKGKIWLMIDNPLWNNFLTLRSRPRQVRLDFGGLTWLDLAWLEFLVTSSQVKSSQKNLLACRGLLRSI
jgi:hypothetical protein